MPEMLTRADVKVSSVNVEARTAEICFATETPVQRRDFDGPYREVLTISRDAIIPDRLNAGISFLDSHRSHSVESVLGTILPGSLRIEGKRAIATVRFSRKARAQEVLDDLADGHRYPVSVGYRIAKEERTEGEGDAVPTIRATRWEPMEISVVPIPADPNAHTRNLEGHMAENDTIERGSEPQTTTRKLGIRERRTFINGLLPQDFLQRHAAEVEELVSDTRNMNEDQVRAEVLGFRVDIQDRAPTFPHSQTRGMGDTGAAERQAREEALYARMTGTKPTDAARPFMEHRIQDHAAGLLQLRGVDTRHMNRDDIFGFGGRGGGMHTVSDFPLLMGNVANKVMLEAYEVAQSPLKTVLARSTTHTDFRPSMRLRLGDIDLLEKVNEAGEVKATSRSEVQANGYALETFARIMKLSRQLLVNDDLGAFADWNRAAGRAAAETENQLLVDLLLAQDGSGPKMMETGKALFHADHGNLAGSGSALDLANLSAARLAMRKQRGFASGQSLRKSYANVVPKYLLVGSDLEVAAETLTQTALYPTTVDDVNPHINRLEVLVEPRLDEIAGGLKSWYLFADPRVMPTLEYAYLTGAPGPQVSTKEGWDVLGTEYRVVLDFGCGPIDFRGAYRNPGIA